MLTTTDNWTSFPYIPHISSRANSVMLWGCGNLESVKRVRPLLDIFSSHGDEKYLADPVTPKAWDILNFSGFCGPSSAFVAHGGTSYVLKRLYPRLSDFRAATKTCLVLTFLFCS